MIVLCRQADIRLNPESETMHRPLTAFEMSCEKTMFPSSGLAISRRLSLKDGNDVGHNECTVGLGFRGLLLLVPVDNITNRENARVLRQLEGRLDLDLAALGENIRAERGDERRVRSCSPMF